MVRNVRKEMMIHLGTAVQEHEIALRSAAERRGSSLSGLVNSVMYYLLVKHKLEALLDEIEDSGVTTKRGRGRPCGFTKSVRAARQRLMQPPPGSNNLFDDSVVATYPPAPVPQPRVVAPPVAPAQPQRRAPSVVQHRHGPVREWRPPPTRSEMREELRRAVVLTEQMREGLE